MDNRSNIVSLVGSYCLVAFFTFAKKTRIKWLINYLIRGFRHVFIFLPLALVLLGGLGVFNLYEFVDRKGSKNEIVISSKSGRILTTDSRTGIYEDAFNNLQKNNDWIFGSSAAVVYKTHLATGNADYSNGRLGGSESGFLAFLTFGGLVYVTLFFLVCYLSSYLAVYKSNNLAIKVVGVFIAFRWLFSFIENTLLLNFTWVTFFFAIGMAFSPYFRSMTDKQIGLFFRNL